MMCWAQSCHNVFQVIRAQAWVESIATGTGEWGQPLKVAVILLGKDLTIWAYQSLAQ